MKTKQLLALGLVACLAFTGCGKKQVKTEEATGTNVKVYKVKPIDISNTVTYTGEIKASDTNAITAEVSAVVKAIHFENGDAVNRGQLLVELNSTDYQTAYDSAMASYNQTKSSMASTVTSAENGVKSAKTALDTAQSNYNREYTMYQQDTTITLAQQTYDDAVADYNRQVSLVEQDATLIAARNAVTQAQTNYDSKVQLFAIGAASQNDVDVAKNSLDSAIAALQTTEAQTQATLDAKQSAVNTAKVNLDNAKTNKGAALESAQNALASAQTAYNNAQSSLATAHTTSKSSLEVAENSMKTAKQNLDKTKIYATSDGYATSKSVTVGQMAQAGTVVCSIKNVNSVDAEVNVTEAVIPFILVGNTALVSVESAGIDNVEGTVTMVNATKDDTTGMYTVRVNIPNDNNKINVGMFAEITLNTDTVTDTIAIPSEALIQDGDTYYVFKAKSDTQAEKVEVEVGVTTKEYTQILLGVEDGDRIITDGKDYLSDSNTAINIQKD